MIELPPRAMIAYIWPKDDPGVRRRVKIAVGLLVAAKLLNISVPFIFKHAVDNLNQGGAMRVLRVQPSRNPNSTLRLKREKQTSFF